MLYALSFLWGGFALWGVTTVIVRALSDAGMPRTPGQVSVPSVSRVRPAPSVGGAE